MVLHQESVFCRNKTYFVLFYSILVYLNLKLYRMKKIIFSAVLFLVFMSVNAQTYRGFEGVIAAGQNDANVLMGAYMAPAMEGLVYSMSGGWYSTAKTHNKLGFDITVGLNTAFVPSNREIFSFADLQFENTITTSSPTSPTVAGNENAADVTVVTSNGNATFTMPEGVKGDLPFNAMPSPVIQVGLGLLFDTDLMVRATPKIGSSDVKGSNFGVGLKHNLMQYLGPLDRLPLNISLVGAYSHLNVDYNFEEDSSIDGQNQRADFRLNSYTVQGVASLDFPIVSVYGSLGYTGGKSEVDVLGTYTVDYAGGLLATTFTDPISLSYNPSSFRTSLGARLNLGFFKIFADYTVQEYNNLSAGVSFSFR